MKAMFGLAGLLVVLAIVGVLAKKQLGAVTATPAGAATGAPTGPAATPKQQVEQFKQGVEAAVQQARPMPDDTK